MASEVKEAIPAKSSVLSRPFLREMFQGGAENGVARQNGRERVESECPGRFRGARFYPGFLFQGGVNQKNT